MSPNPIQLRRKDKDLVKEALDSLGQVSLLPRSLRSRLIKFDNQPWEIAGALTEAESQDLKIIEARLAIVLKPADPIELAEVLFRLVAFYPSGETDARIAKMRAEDFADILSSLPLWVIRDVCRDYKANMISRSGDRQAFCPTAGEIRQECERRIGYLRLQAREVQNVRNAVITPPYGKR